MRAMFDLENYLPFLLNRAGARVATKFTQDVRPRNVTLQEWRVLASLNFDGPQRMSDLAERTSIDRTTLSRLVSRMEQHDLARRSRADSPPRRPPRCATCCVASMAILKNFEPLRRRKNAASG